MYASTLSRSNWLRRASIRLAWYRHMSASSSVGWEVLRSLLEVCANYSLSCLTTLKQASHWHDEMFTSRHAIWRGNDGRTCDRVRGDAWWCWSDEVVRAMLWRKFRNAQKKVEGVTTCHDEIVKCTCVPLGNTRFREQCVTYVWLMARHGANCASPCRLGTLRATKLARLGTPYCGALREQNSC